MTHQIELSEHAERIIADVAALQGMSPEQYIMRFMEAWTAQLTRAARDPDQAWFWTPEWQAGERAADADIAAGKSTRYESDEEFLTALEARVDDPTETDADADP